MNSQAEEATSIADIVKQLLSGIVLVSGVVSFYYFSELQTFYRVLILIALVAAAAGIFLSTALGKVFVAFFAEAKQEVRRVVWPTRDETVRTTMMVVAMVFIVGALLWIVDWLLNWGVQALMMQGIS